MFGLPWLFSIFLLYFFGINCITLFFWGIDKYKAIKNKRRVKEKTLLLLTALGGFGGALIGMGLFHHKTIKSQFLIWFWIISLLWIILLILGLFYAF